MSAPNWADRADLIKATVNLRNMLGRELDKAQEGKILDEELHEALNRYLEVRSLYLRSSHE